MYIVTIENNGVETEIHGEREKLHRGSVVKGINTIDTFSFSILPSNAAFDMLHEFTTLVKVYNVNRNRYEFYGRVLYANPSMSEEGLIEKEVTCESYFGFLCDSQQKYVEEKNWTVRGLLEHIVNTHNSRVESYKRFKIGSVTVSDPNDNLYLGIQRRNTWDTLNEKLLDHLGGELRFRVEEDGLYLDYLTQIGETKQTPIKLSRNMKSINKEHDPTQYITRLIPLGAKLDDSEERLDITSVNDGKEYIDDEQAIATYGLHEGYREWDNVTEPANLKAKAEQWLASNNRVLVKYLITALDLSLIGLDIDDFDVCNKHPVENSLIGVDDVARIIKKTIDICNDTQSTIEVGDNFKTLTDLDTEKKKQMEEQISSNSRGISGVRSSMGSMAERTESRMDEMQAGIDARVLYDEFNDYKIASANMYATIGDMNAGLSAKVDEKTMDNYLTKTAAAELYVGERDVNALIGVYAVSAGGTTKTFAKILADQVTIESNMVTMGDITADVIQNRISSMSTLYVDNALSVSGRSYMQDVSTSNLAVGGTFSLNAQTVTPTKLTLVTDFTQASITTPGGVAAKSDMTILITSIGNAVARQPLEGDTITLN